MHSLADGTIDRLAVLRDRLEAEILRIPGTGAQLPKIRVPQVQRLRETRSPRRQHHQYLV
jgi:hypothetical protein